MDDAMPMPAASSASRMSRLIAFFNARAPWLGATKRKASSTQLSVIRK
ncbi:MAG: hypothetical protein GIW94_12775 [Candidatus Eremiobacteraeota bacterium]|nr:hypothetical protein [Candidatus Eremiobacteraeota bacterium]MBC5823147.1 hypothetical protein [Candidatus Eremiobacteraeota bacterium]